MKLKIVSFNIRCANDDNGHSIEERAPRLQRVISSYSPDVMGLQEYRPAWHPYLESSLFEDYEMYCYPRSSNGVKEAVPLLWKKDKFECMKKGTFWLSDTPLVESGGWDEKYNVNRICSYVVLKEKTSGKLFTFMNTHFGFGDRCQTQSAELIYKFSKEISDYPSFVTGDFNMKQDSAGYAVMTKYFTDVNTATVNDMRTTFHGYEPEKHPDSHIDYCFIDEKIRPITQKIMDETVDGKYPSDHFGIYMELEV